MVRYIISYLNGILSWLITKSLAPLEIKSLTEDNNIDDTSATTNTENGSSDVSTNVTISTNSTTKENNTTNYEKFQELTGHTVIQVIAGFIIGLIVGLIA